MQSSARKSGNSVVNVQQFSAGEKICDLVREGQPCQYCGQNLNIIWVHGHGQCKSCGINIEPCCQGTQI